LSTRFVVDVGKRGGEISPLWFGHNLEHTRSCVWQGLSAQLIRNRKFVGMPQHSGVAQHWLRIGPPQSWYLLEMTGGYKGTDGEPYTAHFDERDGSARQCQRIECFEAGARCGIGQRGIPLAGGRRYVWSLALRSDRELAVTVKVTGAEPVLRLSLRPGDWTEHAFDVAALATDEDARLEVTFDGLGVLWVGAASLLPADHFLGMRRDVVGLLKEIGVPILRWPGGNFAGDYRWKDGLLPVERRAPLASAFIETLPHTDGFDDHQIGTDEFIALCRELGAEPFITLNLSTEGPDEAAAWVEYCNGAPDTEWGSRRAERGHPEPYNVKHWTLGNEMGYTHMKGPHAPSDYNQLAAACARAMRKVDPLLVFTASCGWHQEWFQGVLATEDDYFDNVSHHTYNGIVKHFGDERGREEFRALVACPDTVFLTRGRRGGKQGERLTMLDVRDLIAERPRAGRPIGIAFDEWNVWYAWYRQPGVAEGIYAATMLNCFCREARNAGMAIGCYFEPVNEGAILVEPASARLTPVGQAFALFKTHHGNQLVEVSPSQANELDVAASLDETRRQLAVTIVNRSPEAGKEAEILLRNAGAPSAARGILLTCDNFLPGSVFRSESIDPHRKAGDAFSLSLPPHSVARIQVNLTLKH
jgi:alpha-N-arabinofuranosidase